MGRIRLSNGLVTGLNVLALVLAISALGLSLWAHVKSESRCQRVLKTPLLVFGAALLVVSGAGLVGSCCRVSFILWLYLLALFLLIVGLIGLTVFTIMVTNKGVGKAVSSTGVADYSGWLHKYVVNAQNWNQIKSCLVGVKMCHLMANTHRNMTPVLSGCCKPPSYCGFKFQNATAADPDCKAWSNRQDELCFNCYTCKKAVLDNIRREWRLLAVVNIAIIVFLIIVYSLGCCALRNNRHAHHKLHQHA